MLLCELFTNVSAHEVYHWTSADGMRAILEEGIIREGACTHSLNSKEVCGISVSRNQFFDIEHTFAISGRKAWRIGLDYVRLRQRFRMVPIRDNQYRKIPRNQTIMHPYYGATSSDESEEYILGQVPISFVTSVAVEDRWLDPTVHPDDAYDDGTVESDDQRLLFDILDTEHPDMLDKHRHRPVSYTHVELPRGVPLLCIQRDVPRVIPFNQAWSGKGVEAYR